MTRVHMMSVSTLCLCLALFLLSDVSQSKKNDCDTCTNLVDSMKKGMDKTRTSNFGGGNSEWEETRLGSYATSETRLVEILDSLCGSSDHDCNSMLEEYEESLEEWWFKRQESDNDLKIWLCENTIKVCCPPNTFGPTCEECPGGKDNPCSGKGECLGSGKRDGSGKCSCEVGYEGNTCEACSEGYYEDNDKNCSSCDLSCSLTCHSAGPQGCDSCKHGYNRTEVGCQDVDECANDTSPCDGGHYCVNIEGSYSCLVCDSACADNCTGPGRSGCHACTEGYLMNEELPGCEDVDECKGNSSRCETGRYCKNTVGSFECEFCDVSCATDCTGEGPQHCIDCSQGYKMQDDTCKDVDECTADVQPCQTDTEECINAAGSYECDCKNGYERTESNECIPIPQQESDTKTSDEEQLDTDPLESADSEGASSDVESEDSQDQSIEHVRDEL